VRKVSFIFLSFLILSCQKEEEIDLGNINLLSVSFLKSNNPSLERDIKLTFDNDNTFSGFAPYGTSMKSLIATYEFEGSSIQIDGEEQTNSVSNIDFDKERIVSVLDEGGNGKDYLIRLHYHTGLPIRRGIAFPSCVLKPYSHWRMLNNPGESPKLHGHGNSVILQLQYDNIW